MNKNKNCINLFSISSLITSLPFSELRWFKMSICNICSLIEQLKLMHKEGEGDFPIKSLKIREYIKDENAQWHIWQGPLYIQLIFPPHTVWITLLNTKSFVPNHGERQVPASLDVWSLLERVHDVHVVHVKLFYICGGAFPNVTLAVLIWLAWASWTPTQFTWSFTSAANPKMLSETDSSAAGRPIADIYCNLSSDNDSPSMHWRNTSLQILHTVYQRWCIYTIFINMFFNDETCRAEQVDKGNKSFRCRVRGSFWLSALHAGLTAWNHEAH